ncbi:MAG: GNAT family N-acetyltransferase [Hyphomicrobium sp.]|nr:GNAT family N-acetyltransferase [Hyphomicrobium sp.]
MTTRNLDSLLTPRSVALIGASPTPNSVGNVVARNLLRAGFTGRIQFVNPKHRHVEEQACVTSVRELEGVPDLAVIATPPDTVPSIIAELGAKGVRAAVVITAGLSADQKAAVLKAARPTCLRVQGPNCLGLMLPQIGLDASFSHIAPLKGDLAFLSQSGALVTSIVDWAASRGIGFSYVVSLGDMLDVDFGDLLDYLAADTSSRAILLYIENITNAPKFMSAARRAARAKPVIVIKSGRHSAGAKAALSHTGALAGSDKAYEAAFRRAGVLRVREIEQLFDAAETLSRVGRISGERLTIITNGGGAGVLAVDRLSDWGGSLATLDAPTIAALNAALPPTWSHANPVDIIGDASPERYTAAVEAVLNDKGTDAILVMNCPTALADSTKAAEAVIEAVRAHKPDGRRRPLLSVWLGNGTAEPGRAAFRAAGHPSFESPDDAINGFMQLVRHRRAQDLLMRTPPSLPDEMGLDPQYVNRALKDALKRGETVLGEAPSKDVLAAYGIKTVPTRTAATPEEARAVATELLASSKAVALKIRSPDITHKSDVGGVRLDLTTPEDCADAAEAMLSRIKRLKPDAVIEGFTVQPMIRKKDAHELFAGVSTDQTFGPLIVFGAGGTGVEVMRDTAEALPPLDLGLAHDLMAQTRVSRLLAGYRDRPAADLDRIAMVLVRLSYLVAEHPEIREIDINPLLADDHDVVALDARIVIADPVLNPRVPMSIRPYPSRWETDFLLGGNQELLIRPIRPDDELRYDDFFKQVTPHDMRMRFFMAAKSLNHATIARLTQIDYGREMAFVAIEKATGTLLGVARMMAGSDYQKAEFAVLVASHLKGKGLGKRLMQHLIAYARAEGLSELSGTVLAENQTMLDFCARLGFAISDDPEDAGVRLATLNLANAKAA